MNELVDWLRAQLDEDERVAQEATPGPWAVAENGEVYAPEFDRRVKYGPGSKQSSIEHLYVTCDGEGLSPSVDREQAEHIARHDPARVLREVAAKRAIISAAGWAREAENNDYTAGWAEGLEHSLYLLAVAYEDRDGYREEWAPS